MKKADIRIDENGNYIDPWKYAVIMGSRYNPERPDETRGDDHDEYFFDTVDEALIFASGADPEQVSRVVVVYGKIVFNSSEDEEDSPFDYDPDDLKYFPFSRVDDERFTDLVAAVVHKFEPVLYRPWFSKKGGYPRQSGYTLEDIVNLAAERGVSPYALLREDFKVQEDDWEDIIEDEDDEEEE